MGLEAEIWAWRLGEGGTKKEKEEKEKIPVWKYRSLTPSGPLPKRTIYDIENGEQ